MTPDDNQKLADQYTEIVELVGGLAHEIKNPLSTIVLNMELLAEDLESEHSPRGRRALQRVNLVQQECKRLKELLDDFLNYAKVRPGRLEPSDLNESLRQVLDFFQPNCRSLGIEVIRYLDPDLPSVLLDRETFHRALLNLVLNAQQAMPHGGELVARTRLSKFGVALDLIDTGCGMNAATMQKMFETFYSTKPGGSGLGLPTTRKIIEAHGGYILVHSEEGVGTQFTIELPTPARIATGEAVVPTQPTGDD